MNRMMRRILYLLTVLSVLTACSKQENDEAGKGRLMLTTEWSNRGAGIDVPANYWVVAGPYASLLSGTSNLFPDELEAGRYRLIVYNPADHISVIGTTASVTNNDGTINALPGWFFTSAQDLTIRTGTTTGASAAMVQQVGQVTIALKPDAATSADISGIGIFLAGIAGSLDLETGTVKGSAVNVKSTLAKQPDGSYKTTVRLMGTIGAAQKLTISLIAFGSANQIIEVDTSAKLARLNDSKKTPITLTLSIHKNNQGGYYAQWEE